MFTTFSPNKSPRQRIFKQKNLYFKTYIFAQSLLSANFVLIFAHFWQLVRAKISTIKVERSSR